MRGPRVNIIIQKGGALTREQWVGIAEAVSLRRGAELSFIGFHPPFVKRDLRRISDFSIDGLIGMFGRRDYADFIRRLGVPAVSVFGGKPFAGIPQVGTDDEAIGLLAAGHLALPGVVSFGFLGLPDHRPSSARWAGFVTGLRKLGFEASRFRPELAGVPIRRFRPSRLIPWESALHAWLEGLAKPAAVFCVDDLRGYWVSGACERLELRVPDDVAILGVGDDPGYVLAVSPNLSSIRVPARQEGFLAASALLDWLEGRRSPERAVFLPPAGVAARASTDILHTTNPHVARAVRFIRERRGMEIRVDDVARNSGCCRKVLERLFRIHLGTTILQEMRREQIAQAQATLRDTTLPIERIAELCGYSSFNHLARDFKKRTGIPPGAYRRKFRGDAGELHRSGNLQGAPI